MKEDMTAEQKLELLAVGADCGEGPRVRDRVACDQAGDASWQRYRETQIFKSGCVTNFHGLMRLKLVGQIAASATQSGNAGAEFSPSKLVRATRSGSCCTCASPSISGSNAAARHPQGYLGLQRPSKPCMIPSWKRASCSTHLRCDRNISEDSDMAAHPDLQMILEETLCACHLQSQRISAGRMKGKNFLSQPRYVFTTSRMDPSILSKAEQQPSHTTPPRCTTRQLRLADRAAAAIMQDNSIPLLLSELSVADSKREADFDRTFLVLLNMRSKS